MNIKLNLVLRREESKRDKEWSAEPKNVGFGGKEMLRTREANGGEAHCVEEGWKLGIERREGIGRWDSEEAGIEVGT